MRVVLGAFGRARSRVRHAPADLNFFHVRLKDRSGGLPLRGTPTGTTSAWLAVDRGSLQLHEGERVLWEQIAVFRDFVGVGRGPEQTVRLRSCWDPRGGAGRRTAEGDSWIGCPGNRIDWRRHRRLVGERVATDHLGEAFCEMAGAVDYFAGGYVDEHQGVPARSSSREASASRAGERLDISTAMVSKHVMHVEQRLGLRLLNRNSRTLSLTEPGRVYFERCKTILEDLEDTELELGSLNSAPRGTLRISCPSWSPGRRIAEHLAEYRRRYPEVVVDVSFEDRMVDLVEEGYDLAFRVTSSDALSPGLIARPVRPVSLLPGCLEAGTTGATERPSRPRSSRATISWRSAT